MAPISVIVHGALGKVGKEIIAALSKDPGFKLAGAVDIKADTEYIAIEKLNFPLYRDLGSLLKTARPQVMIDFSIAEACLSASRLAAESNINLVIGTTGFSGDETIRFTKLAKDNNIGIIISPNFALGAVLLMHFASLASKYFDNAEIIELHHDEKADAPSGTALNTARMMLESRKGKPFNYHLAKKVNLDGSRGGQLGGIGMHSVRLPGFVASEEVIFGMQGQTLKIRHDAINRECYMPGIILAAKEVSKYKGSVKSLEDLLQLGGK
jgi:4-hydroxy-tetrahydrodipicolinate reductase